MKGMYRYPDDPSMTSHLMMAMNISAIMEPDEMKVRMADFADRIHASPMWDESKEMLLPGEPEYRTEELRKVNGIPMPQNLYQELLALAEDLEVSASLPKM